MDWTRHAVVAATLTVPSLGFAQDFAKPAQLFTPLANPPALAAAPAAQLGPELSKIPSVDGEPAETSHPVARPVALLHALDGAPFLSCQNGECTSDVRVTTTNYSPAQRAAARQDPALAIVRDQAAHLEDIHAVTADALESADGLVARDHGAELVDLTIYLREQPFNFRRLRAVRGQDADAFDAIIAERDAQLEPLYASLREAVESVGGYFGGGLTFSSIASAKVPAQAFERILGAENVIGIELDGKDVSNADGAERRLSIGLPAGGLSGLDGGVGSTRSSGAVHVGVIEVGNSLNTSHVSWLDWVGGPSRVIDTDDCHYVFPIGRRCRDSATTTGDTHGTNVSSVLLGSIEQGQNSSITTTLGRQQRSGVAREAELHYYRYSARADLARAFDEAARDNGIDIINLSAAPTGSYCDNASYSGVRSEVQAATDAGILIFVAAGNDADDNPAGTCTVSGYASFPDTVAVGATDDVTGLGSLDTVDLADYSGRGTTSVTLEGGRTLTTRMVDIIATGDADRVAASGTTGVRDTRGTSFASPLVAGAGVLLKDWIGSRGGLGGLENDPYALRTLMMAMGDGVSSTSGGGTGFGFTVSDHSGFGHLRFVNLSTELGSTWGWGVQRRTVSEGQVIEWPVGNSAAESSAVTGWKLAATWDWNTYNDSPDVKLQLIDRCDASGTVRIIRTAARHPLKGRIRMRESEMSSLFHGRCLYIRATIEHASSSFSLYTADYYYSNSRDEHDM